MAVAQEQQTLLWHGVYTPDYVELKKSLSDRQLAARNVGAYMMIIVLHVRGKGNQDFSKKTKKSKRSVKGVHSLTTGPGNNVFEDLS
jgi:hypothetical protein